MLIYRFGAWTIYFYLAHFQVFPMAVVGTANRGIVIYQLDNVPQEFKRMESPLKYQVHIELYQDLQIMI